MGRNNPTNAKKSNGCLYILMALIAFFILIGTYRWMTNTDSDWDRFTMESLQEAIDAGDVSTAKRHLTSFKTDSFRLIAEEKFPNIDALIAKQKTAPYRVVESIQYPKNKAGISSYVHTIIVDNLYLDEVVVVVVPKLSRQYDDGNAHQIYLHASQPLKLSKVAKEKDRIGVIQVAKKGAFGYFTRSKIDDGVLMGVDKKGNYVDFEQ
jgi:hypothetical protein